MEALGKRIAAIRSEQGLSQSELGRRTGLGQPRVSKLESSELPASVAVIDKLAKAFGRMGRDLVRGTDREGYYLAEVLSPDEIANERRLGQDATAFDVLILQQIYDRIVALFQAVYSGPYIAVNIAGVEEMYIDLRARCLRLVKNSALPIPDLCLPDHLDVIDQDDVDGWEFTEVELKKSSLALKQVVYDVKPSEQARRALTFVLEYLKIDAVDKSIIGIRDAVTSENQKWLKQVKGAARKHGSRLGNAADVTNERPR